MQLYGFVYSPELTQMVRDIARGESGSIAVTGEKANAQHIWLTMKVCVYVCVCARVESTAVTHDFALSPKCLF